ncbi:unnamed protein product [Cuscuta epithymum]|uniref:Ubiquitin-like domain-containing protein n=1 Tax=Cuscuta epithymum TaxID=186058 RepID=A0AAV0DTB2_9ASTE|nr:unnamed protein product [Cuscuta epithymum]
MRLYKTDSGLRHNRLTATSRKVNRQTEMEEAGGSEPTTITVNVQVAGSSILFNISPDSTVKKLKSVLQQLTNVLPGAQKLISKGKILVDEMTLRSSEVDDGSKIMLLPSPSLAKLIEEWKLTRMIVLSHCYLKAIPDAVLEFGNSALYLDLDGNTIKEVPERISHLSSIMVLYLNANVIEDQYLSWEGIQSLKSLIVLSMNENRLTILPSSLGALTRLRQLHISKNKLTSLPIEIGLLTKLEVLNAHNNRLSTIPTSISGCASLEYVDISSNLLTELPDTLGKLKNLEELLLGDNRLTSLPTTIFSHCNKLYSLDLHRTGLTRDYVRQLDGWNEFKKRKNSEIAIS